MAPSRPPAVEADVSPPVVPDPAPVSGPEPVGPVPPEGTT